MIIKRGFFFLQIFLLIIFFPNVVSSSDYFSSTGHTFYSEGDLSLNLSQTQAITVLRDNFNGETTDFTLGGNIALQSLVDMILEKYNYGRVVFDEIINLTKDAYSPTGTLYDRVVDIDSNMVISTNFLSANYSALTSLNKSATITLYGISVTSPKIMVNGEECPSSLCSLVSYSGGAVVFEVTYFHHASRTTYFLVEGAEEEEETPPSGGGGGGGSVPIPGDTTLPNQTRANFYTVPNTISIEIEKGKLYSRQIEVFNSGTRDLTISVSPSASISQFVRIDERSFLLKKGESRNYNFYVYSSSRNKADLYTGKIIFTSAGATFNLDLAITVQELPILFDMRTIVLKKYVLPGGIAHAEIRKSNLGDAEFVDVVLEYGVMDFDNNIIVSRVEEVTVEKSITSKKVSLKLPDGLETGRYIFYSKIIYGEKTAVSSDTFQVERISVLMWVIFLILIFILVLLIFFAIFVLRRRKKEEKIKKELESKRVQTKLLEKKT